MPNAVSKPTPAPTPAWYTVLWSAVGVAALVAVAGFWLAGEVLESVTDRDGLAIWDRPVLDWMIASRTPTADGVIAWYSNAGGPLWQPIITGLGKRAVGRVRPPFEESIPPHELSASFPSGHSLNAVVIAGILCYLILIHLEERRPIASGAWIAFFTVYAVTMGLSRVYLGHHWLTDVLAAWVLGLAWLAMVIGVHRLWHAMRPQPDKGPAPTTS